MHNKLTKIILAKRPKEESLQYCRSHNAWQELASLSLHPDYNLAWRATWLLSHLSAQELKGLDLNIAQLIKQAKSQGHSLQRETLKLLAKLSIPEERLSAYFDWAEAIWVDIKMQSSVRIAALKAMARVAAAYPELKSEIIALSDQELLSPLSPGISRQARAIFQSLDNS